MCFSRYALYGLVAFAQHDYLLLCMQILCIITHLTSDEYHYLKKIKNLKNDIAIHCCLQFYKWPLVSLLTSV